MPTVTASRTLAAAPEAVWEVVGDPHHLPRWWPRVTRVEAVAQAGGEQAGAFTEVLSGRKGKVVRADFTVLEASPVRRFVFSQELADTPFENVLRSAVTQIDLIPAAAGSGAATQVRLELRQELPGPLRGRAGPSRSGGWLLGLPRLGSLLVKRAAAATLEQALDGLVRVFGDGG